MKSLSVICIVVAFASYSFACGLHNRYWCDSVENAMQCDVYEQCKPFLYPESTSAHQVFVTLYYESLCPDSINFIRQSLYPTWLKLKSSGIAKFGLVPYGKSCSYDDHGTYSFICQHGKDECQGNIIENCLTKYGNYDPDVYLPVIHCMSTAPDEVLGNAKKCISEDKNYDYSEIMKCAEGPEGSGLTYRSGVETHNLKYPLYSVPWVLINGLHTDSIQKQAMADLLSLICNTYTGTKPAECTGHLKFEADIMK